MMSLRDTALGLKANRHWLRGYCEAKGYEFVRVGTALCLKPEDFEAVRKYVAERKRKAKARPKRKARAA